MLLELADAFLAGRRLAASEERFVRMDAARKLLTLVAGTLVADPATAWRALCDAPPDRPAGRDRPDGPRARRAPPPGARTFMSTDAGRLPTCTPGRTAA